MAIGTTAAILGSAAISAGASAIGASKNSKAINTATEAQTQSNAASIALQREVFNDNKQTLSPFVSRGNAAGDAMNALLGLGGGAARPINGAQPIAGGQNQPQANALYNGGYGTASQFQGARGSTNGFDPFGGSGFNPAYAADINPRVGSNAPNRFWQNYMNGGAQGGQQSVPTAQPAAQAPQSGQDAANDAFDVFRNSTGYQFRVNEGMEALNSGYAGSGLLQSGAALKGLDDYRQNAASAEFGNYMGYLGNQQGVGLSAASAQAGVGQSYANNVSSLNSQNANALANAAVAKANNSNALIGGITSGIGNAVGFLGGG